MKLQLPKGILDEIRAHGRAAYPSEGCGVLLGTMDDSGFNAAKSVRMENSRKEQTNYEFVIEPEALLRVMKEARKEGFDIVGFYHSHPDHPARPSDKDKKWGGETWPGVAHMIIAVAKGVPGDMGAWVYDSEAAAFQDIKVDIR